MNTTPNTPQQTRAAREALLADPRRVSPEAEAAIRNDPALRQLRQQLLDTDAQAARAFDEVAPPPGLAERIILRGRLRVGSRSRWAAGAAASFVIAAAAFFMLQPQPDSPSSPLALAMMDHVIETKYELDDDDNVAPTRVKASLAALGVQYRDAGYRVRHLADCLVAGRMGKHLVMNTPSGIVSFIILPDNGEALPKRQKLGKGQFHAVFTPQPRAAYGAFAEKNISAAELESLMNKLFVQLPAQT
jgi:Protein of unknown function (DUF3379)